MPATERIIDKIYPSNDGSDTTLREAFQKQMGSGKTDLTDQLLIQITDNLSTKNLENKLAMIDQVVNELMEEFPLRRIPITLVYSSYYESELAKI